MDGLYVIIKEVEGKNVHFAIVVERPGGGKSEQHGMIEIGEAIEMNDILEEAKEDGYQRGLKDGRE